MRKYRGKRKRGKTGKNEETKSREKPDLATSMTWAGKDAKVNTLTDSVDFDPSVPIGTFIDQPGEEGDDALIWADVPAALEKRLKEEPQLITEECLKCNAKGILRLYENDIVQHVIKQQLHSDHMAVLVRRQGAYAQSKQTAREMKVRGSEGVG